jgi:hypothetical protein
MFDCHSTLVPHQQSFKCRQSLILWVTSSGPGGLRGQVAEINATTVIVEFGAVRLQIGLHHGETAFAVASVFAPRHWEAFQLIVSGITRWPSDSAATARTTFAGDLTSFALVLRRSVGFLQEAMSKDNVHSTLTKAIEMENASIDAYAERARANGIEPVIYTSP